MILLVYYLTFNVLFIRFGLFYFIHIVYSGSSGSEKVTTIGNKLIDYPFQIKYRSLASDTDIVKGFVGKVISVIAKEIILMKQNQGKLVRSLAVNFSKQYCGESTAIEMSFASISIPIFLEHKPNMFKLSESLWKQPSIETKAQTFSHDLHKSFLIQELILKCLGRFPFNYNSNNLFVFNIKGAFHWLYFGITTFCVLSILGLSSVGFAEFYLQWQIPIRNNVNSTIQKQELCHFNQNLVPFVLLWGCMVHIAVGSISMIVNRKKITYYFQLWRTLMDQLCIPISASIRRFLVQSNIWLMVFISGILFFFYHKKFFTTICGISKLLILLSLRLLLPPGHALEVIQSESNFYPTIGLIGVIYIIYASRALIFVYTFNCRLLRHCFRTWNERLKDEFSSYRDCNDAENLEIETEICQTLFKQFVKLIEIMRETDIVFAANLESYYLTQVLNMCFELYYLAMSGTCVFGSGLDDRMKGQGLLVAGLLIIQTFVIFFTVSLEATYVSDEAMKGLQFLRKRGIQLNDTIEKKYLVQNLLIIYSQPIVLTGGRFFSIDRPFIIRVLGAVFTYFIIILQFGSQSQGECGG